MMGNTYYELNEFIAQKTFYNKNNTKFLNIISNKHTVISNNDCRHKSYLLNAKSLLKYRLQYLSDYDYPYVC